MRQLTTEELEHIQRALKLYANTWNSMMSQYAVMKLTADDIENIKKLRDDVKAEIKFRKLHE